MSFCIYERWTMNGKQRMDVRMKTEYVFVYHHVPKKYQHGAIRSGWFEKWKTGEKKKKSSFIEWRWQVWFLFKNVHCIFTFFTYEIHFMNTHIDSLIRCCHSVFFFFSFFLLLFVYFVCLFYLYSKCLYLHDLSFILLFCLG